MTKMKMTFFCFSTPLKRLREGLMTESAQFIATIGEHRIYAEATLDELRRLGYKVEESGYLINIPPEEILVEVSTRRASSGETYEVTRIYPADA